MSDDPSECYQAIAQALDRSARPGWHRIEVDVTLDGQRVDVVASCWTQTGTRPVEYLTGVPRLARYFYDLARLVSTEEKGLFKTCRFVLASDGHFNVSYGY